ncbi:MAG: hypothetical protein M3R50_01770, partial [Bacteroidota bacterium]|nr:hypothetical protein [Bacteroidota bacterium]
MKRCLQSIVFCVVSLLLCNNGLFAQSQLSIKNFAIFGGDSTASFVDSLTSGVQSASIVTITGGGLVGTQTYLQLKDTVKIDANVYGNIVTIGSNFILNGGSLSVFNRQNFNYNVLSEGNFSQFGSPGNINVNGPANIGVVGGRINGAVTISSPYSYSGPGPANGIDSVAPVFPTMPVMPPTTAFPAAGATNITSTQSIVPGSYGNMNLSAQQAIAFSGPGIYVFNSITNLTNDTFKFDFQNNITGSIRIYVVGNVDLNSINTVLVNGGSPSRVYMENHGTSFIINTAGNFDSRFTGIIYAPLGTVTIGNPNVYSIHVTTFTGSVWSRKKVTIGYNTTFNFAPLSESADPSPNSLILPYYIPPADGKVNTIIGSELTSLYEHPGAITQDSIIYRISGDSVYIEAITRQGQYAAALSFLQSNGLTNIINNGAGTVIISGKFPIANLLLLNAHSELFDYVRPLYYPINNSGVVTTSGDTVMSSNIVRKGYNLDGTGVKVGVISDSYNTIPGSYAGIDVRNGDLPGAGNPNGNTTPVQILQEYPFGPGVDEGRAMLQIVHDMAPNAPLAFTTGFV